MALIRLILPLLLLAYAPLLPAQTQPNAESVLDLHRQKFQWMVERDTASLDALLDEDVVYVHSNGWHESKTEVLHNIASRRLRYHQVEVLASTVRQYDTAWIINGRGRFDVALEDQAWVLILDYTEVYVLQDGALQLVSRHACRVPEPE